MTPRACRKCGLPTGKPYGNYCDNCRWRVRGKPLMYVWTPERDDVLRRRYDSRVRGRVAEVAKALAWPKYVIQRRAKELGLARPHSERAWTAEEVAFLESHAGLRLPGWMAKKLKRTHSSVVLKLKRLQLSMRIREGYTLMDLQECFGCNHHAVDRWIREGKLKGSRRYGNDAEREPWLFTDDNVRSFIRENPMAFRLDKVDQLWFMDLVLRRRPLASESAA